MQNTQNTTNSGASHYQTALVVDDDAYSLHLTEATLAALGIGNIACANDGASGLRRFDRMSPKPDLVVCDLYMPDKDGIEFINDLGARNYSGAIILVTGGDLSILQMATQVAVRGHGLKLLGAFAKPLLAEDLARVTGLALPVA